MYFSFFEITSYHLIRQTNVNVLAQPLLLGTNNWVACLERQCGSGQEGGRRGGKGGGGGWNQGERDVEVGWVSGYAIFSIFCWRNTLLWVCVCPFEKKGVQNVCERERERESWGEKKVVKNSLCGVFESQRACTRARVCVWERERAKWWEREGEREGVQMQEFDGQSTLAGSVALLRAPLLPHPVTTPPPSPPLPRSSPQSPAARPWVSDFEWWVEICTALANFDQTQKRTSANHAMNYCLQLSRQWWCRRSVILFFGDFHNLSGKSFLKKRKAWKKTNGIPPKYKWP